MTITTELAPLRQELLNPAIGSNHHLRKLALSLLDALEAKDKQIAESTELAELQRDKIKRLTTDLFNEEQLRKVHSSKSFELESENRELKSRNDKDFVWRGKEITRLNDELDDAKERIAELEARTEQQPVPYSQEQRDKMKAIIVNKLAGNLRGHQLIMDDVHAVTMALMEAGFRVSPPAPSPVTVKLRKFSVGEVMHISGFSRDYAEGWCAGNDNARHEIQAAGIKIAEGE